MTEVPKMGPRFSAPGVHSQPRSQVAKSVVDAGSRKLSQASVLDPSFVYLTNDRCGSTRILEWIWSLTIEPENSGLAYSSSQLHPALSDRELEKVA
jgi:hypothetical protein